jgi:hypothetical protein
MNQNISRPTVSPALNNKNKQASAKGLGQMADSMKKAVTEFDTDKATGLLASAIALLKPFSAYGSTALRTSTSFARRHPISLAIGAAAIGILVYRSMRSVPDYSNPTKENA